ncbi:MAG: hypothetical protein NVSMB5_13150 [Candidatus Velthaea sp.]
MSLEAHVRELRAGDVDALGDVLSRAYDAPQDFRRRLQAYLENARARTFVVEHECAPAGVVIGNDYTTVGYISLMGVDPRLHRRGLATQLMRSLIAWSAERGFACLELDATEAGAPLYERFGFIDAGRTEVYMTDAPGGRPSAARGCSQADRDTLLAFDRAAFGADRRSAIEPLLVHCGNRAFILEDEATFRGYAIAQPAAGLIGPVVAIDAGAAETLIDAARSVLLPPYRASVPAEQPVARDVLRARGFVHERSLRHMVRGTSPEAARERIFVRANLGQG